MAQPKILCVVGPTACGKTKMGILLAQAFHGEVVSVDSMQIYRGMTIGTAAPTEEEMDRMKFADASSRQRWSEYIASDEYLCSHRGAYAERNAMQTPMEHTLDLHLAHGFYFNSASRRKVELSLDVMNLGNMICRDWGTYYNVSGVRLQPVTITAVEDGAPVYRFTDAKLTTDDLLSRWRMQLGVRVVF